MSVLRPSRAVPAGRSALLRDLAAARAAGREGVLLVLDLDGFACINDAFGQAAGDFILAEVGRRLAAGISGGERLYRSGGDEFAVLILGRQDGVVAGERLAAALRTPVRLPLPTGEQLPVELTASVGVAASPPSSVAAAEHLHAAVTAMRHAKRLGRDRVVLYDDDLRSQGAHRARVERLLRQALPQDRLRLHYQPLVDLGTGRVLGAEALLRMVDDDGSLVPPAEFIALAEATSLMVPIGTWVLREACRQLAAWQRAHSQPLTMAVNCSARQVSRPDFAATVLAAVRDAGVAPSSLTLELTESALLEATPSTLDQLRALRALGVCIGVDDFGTGYASLRYLRDLPVSFLKVDRSFVAGLTHDPADASIVRAVVTLARDLGLDCVAEGIETAEQLAALQELGPLSGQGYLLSRPKGSREVELVLDLQLCELPAIADVTAYPMPVAVALRR